MTFDLKYPGADDRWESPRGAEPWTLVAAHDENGPCSGCGRATRFIALAFEAWICSDECLGRLDEEFMRSLEGPGPGERDDDDEPGF